MRSRFEHFTPFVYPLGKSRWIPFGYGSRDESFSSQTLRACAFRNPATLALAPKVCLTSVENSETRKKTGPSFAILNTRQRSAAPAAQLVRTASVIVLRSGAVA
jgi:hypothetical protein